MGAKGREHEAFDPYLHDSFSQQFSDYLDYWIVRSVVWAVVMFQADDVFAWWWGFMRYIVPGCGRT